MGPKPKGARKLAQWNARQKRARVALKALKPSTRGAAGKRFARAKALASNSET